MAYTRAKDVIRVINWCSDNDGTEFLIIRIDGKDYVVKSAHTAYDGVLGDTIVLNAVSLQGEI